MREEIICSGFGGQGIMSMGKLLAQAALVEDKQVTWMPCYGAEVRGGTAHSMVIISDEPIASPVILWPDVCFAMNNPSLIKFEGQVKVGGLLIVNSSLAKNDVSRLDITTLRFPFTDLASRLGNVRVANMLAIGAYLAKKRIILLENMIASLEEIISSQPNIRQINIKALKEGMKLIKNK
jgi:2-oxoglutarate ferredoxin oxidoreductase subunit gamma